jgi:hypothetical protein
MKVELYRFGDPHVRVVRLSRRVVLHHLYRPATQGTWLLAIDPETLVASVVVRLPDGFVPDIDGHEDLFPLLMTLERADGILEGGDWLVAHTPNKRQHDGIYRSYRVEWDDPNPNLTGPSTFAPHPNSLQVFICHAAEDKPAARKLYDELVQAAYVPWLDEQRLLPGQEWKAEIRKAVRETDVVILLLSKRSVSKSGFVQVEVKLALQVAEEQPEGVIFVIPLRLEDCSVPDCLGTWQWVDYFAADGPEKLRRALRARAATLQSRET